MVERVKTADQKDWDLSSIELENLTSSISNFLDQSGIMKKQQNQSQLPNHLQQNHHLHHHQIFNETKHGNNSQINLPPSSSSSNVMYTNYHNSPASSDTSSSTFVQTPGGGQISQAPPSFNDSFLKMPMMNSADLNSTGYQSKQNDHHDHMDDGKQLVDPLTSSDVNLLKSCAAFNLSFQFTGFDLNLSKDAHALMSNHFDSNGSHMELDHHASAGGGGSIMYQNNGQSSHNSSHNTQYSINNQTNPNNSNSSNPTPKNSSNNNPLLSCSSYNNESDDDVDWNNLM